MEYEDKFTFTIELTPVYFEGEGVDREQYKCWIKRAMENLVDQQCEIEKIEVE